MPATRSEAGAPFPARPHALCDQRNGGEKSSPPSVHWAFSPRAMLLGVPSPMLSAKISP
jgi:hypothetical protein